jgi:hypothetical protein
MSAQGKICTGNALPSENLRQMAHKEIDKFVDKLAPILDKGKPMTLRQASNLFQGEKHKLLGGILRHFIEINHQDVLAQNTADYPRCGKTLKKDPGCRQEDRDNAWT